MKTTAEAAAATQQQSRQVMPKLYGLEGIEKATSQGGFATTLIDRIQDGFVKLEKGDEFFACPIQTMGLPPYEFIDNVEAYAAQTCVKSTYPQRQHQQLSTSSIQTHHI